MESEADMESMAVESADRAESKVRRMANLAFRFRKEARRVLATSVLGDEALSEELILNALRDDARAKLWSQVTDRMSKGDGARQAVQGVREEVRTALLNGWYEKRSTSLLRTETGMAESEAARGFLRVTEGMFD